MNIHSYVANVDNLEVMFRSLRVDPDIFAQTETWLKYNNTDLCNVDCYQSFHTCRPERRSGGVSVLCKKVDFICDLSCCSINIETCVVKT